LLQALLHLPQLFLSALVFTHVPLQQVGVEPPQVLPHAPQLLLSVFVSVQVCMVVPLMRQQVVVGPWAWQLVPHKPQLVGRFWLPAVGWH
jgi:hypothetical protein